MGGLYLLIRQEKPYFKKQINPSDHFRVFVVEPQQKFMRVQIQSGAFLISVLQERFERCEALNWNSIIPIYNHYKLNIPNEKK